MKEVYNIIIIFLLILILCFTYFMYDKYNNIDSKINDLNNKIEIRIQQNDSINKKLDSIAVKKIEVINKIDNRKTTINNLFNDLKYSKPTYDTSLSAAVNYLHEFSKKQY